MMLKEKIVVLWWVQFWCLERRYALNLLHLNVRVVLEVHYCYVRTREHTLPHYTRCMRIWRTGFLPDALKTSDHMNVERERRTCVHTHPCRFQHVVVFISGVVIIVVMTLFKPVSGLSVYTYWAGRSRLSARIALHPLMLIQRSRLQPQELSTTRDGGTMEQAPEDDSSPRVGVGFGFRPIGADHMDESAIRIGRPYG